MKLNKMITAIIVSLLCVNVYAKALNLQSVKVDYINFDNISLENLCDFLGKEYGINFSIEPQRKDEIISVHLRRSNLHDLLESLLTQYGMSYEIRNSIIYISSSRQYLEKRFAGGKYQKSRVTLKYASVSDAVMFLQDMMPGRTKIRTSTENRLYSNLYNATPDLAIPDTQSQTQTQTQNQADDMEFRLFSEESGQNRGTGRQSGAGGGRGMGGRYSGQYGMMEQEVTPDDVLVIVPFYNENKIYFLSTSSRMISEAKRFIAEIDKPSKQVMIQGQVIEFTVGDGFNSIFDFQFRDSKLVPDSANPQSVINFGNLRYSFLDSQLVANIDIAKSEGRAAFVSSPMLLTMNRVSANLDLTEEVSIITGVKEGSVTTYDSGTVIVPPIPVYATKKLGTQLTITPFINSVDEILLKIEVNIASLSGNTQTIVVPTATGSTEEFTFDSVSESKIDTLLTTADKKTIVIGGLIRDTVSKKNTKTPILGDIPVLGLPFRKTEESTQKKELIIILTPTIVDLKNPKGEENIMRARKRFDGYEKINRFTQENSREEMSRKHSNYNGVIEEFLKE